MNLKSLTERMQAVWKQAGMKGGVQIMAMGGTYFLFRFANVYEDFNLVITIGPWFVFGPAGLMKNRIL